MSSWTIGEYRFDARRRRLVGRGDETLLEPKASTLLEYLCEHPDRNIGRDELLQHVWYGRVVSDNTINRVIVLLRKAFRDEEKVRQYILTVPKVGYRLIAPVARNPRVVDEQREQDDTDTTGARRTGLQMIAGVLLLLAAAGALWWPMHPESQSVQRSVIPLSRLSLSQSNADLAPDGKALLFTAPEAGWRQIFLQTDLLAEPVRVSQPGGHADFAKWSPDGSFAVYQSMGDERCEVHRIAPSAQTVDEAEVIYECLPGSYSELVFSPDGSTIYFVERDTGTAPYAVYALDLKLSQKRRLSQPVAQGYGNHFVDVHPRSGKLLVLSDHAPGKTALYELDPVADSFQLLLSLDHSIESAIWSHRDGYVVHPSAHPSYRLLETALDSAQSEVLVSDSRRLSGVRRLHNTSNATSDYLFTSYLINRDLQADDIALEFVNSAVMDYLPAISRMNDRIAFVSKRSGESEIWVHDIASESLTRIAPPGSGRRFLDLSWSPDDSYLLANTNRGVLVFSLAEGRVVHAIERSLPMYGVGWYGERSIAFSEYEEGQWQAYTYDLETDSTTALDPRWAFVLRNQEQEVRFDQSLVAYRDGDPLTELAPCASPVWRGQLRVRLDGMDIYCHAADRATDLLVIDAVGGVSRLAGAVDRFEFFDVRAGRLVTTTVTSAYSDIMRTQNQPD